MHILVVGPHLLPTDGMIFEGTRYLFDLAGVRMDEYQLYTDNNNNPILPHKTPTHIIVLGTPWVWDQCYKSNKYRGLAGLFEKYPSAKKLFFGIGSCLPLGKEQMIKADLISNSQHLAPLFTNATIVTRDILATEILKDYAPTPLPCPAYYAINPDYRGDSGPDAMIWYDPTIGLSSVDYAPGSELLDRFISGFIAEYKLKKPQVYCIALEEIALALKLGLPTPRIVKGTGEAKVILANARSIYSGRVHMAVPAYRLQKDITLISVDSRGTVLSDVQCGAIKHPDVALDDYIKILTNWAQ